MNEVATIILISLVSVFIIVPLLLVAWAFVAGLVERIAVKMEGPLHYLFRMVDWAYGKGRGQR